MRNKLINIIKKHAHETYDDIINEHCYMLDEHNITDVADEMLKSGYIKDNQVYQVQEYNYDESTGKKIGFNCPACGGSFGINRLYQFCPKCGAKIKGWRQ